MITGRIFNIQRFSTEDGPGIRTTVFLKGCPLTCVWCSNPESQLYEDEVAHRDSLCVGCGECVAICPEGAIREWPKGDGFKVRVNRTKCRQCGMCVGACVHGAMVTYGQDVSVDEVFGEVRKDIGYYKESGGGVTASGGEALIQAEFVTELFRRCHRIGIHTTLDTSGYGSRQACESVCSETDLVLFDLKVLDRAEHKRLTGRSNDVILRNFEWMVGNGVLVKVRVPVVPGVNDSDCNLESIADYVAGLGGGIAVDILPYHGYGESKYGMLDKKYKLTNTIRPTDEAIDRVLEIFRGCGLECAVQ